MKMAEPSRKRARQEGIVEKFVWIDKVSGLPQGVMWPGKVVSREDGLIMVYIRSDHAELKVKMENVVPFNVKEMQKFKDKSMDILMKKKRICTLNTLRDDIDWVIEELEMTAEENDESEGNIDENENIISENSDKNDENVDHSDVETEFSDITDDNDQGKDYVLQSDTDHVSDSEEDLTNIDLLKFSQVVQDEVMDAPNKNQVLLLEKNIEQEAVLDRSPQQRKVKEDEQLRDSSDKKDENVDHSDVETVFSYITNDNDQDKEYVLSDTDHVSDSKEDSEEDLTNIDLGTFSQVVQDEVLDAPNKNQVLFIEKDLEQEAVLDRSPQQRKVKEDEQVRDSSDKNDENVDHSDVEMFSDITDDNDQDQDYVLQSDTDHVSDSEEDLTNIDLGKFLQVVQDEVLDAPNKNQVLFLERNLEQEAMLDRSPQQRKVKEEEKLRDSRYKNIYIKKYVKSKEGKSGLKKDDRPYDTVHACKFCQKLYTHIQDHVEKKHNDQAEVKEIMNLRRQMEIEVDKGPLKKQIKKLQDFFRFSGDHIHNKKVMDLKEGELLIQRKSCAQDKLNVEEYGPCAECLQWIKLETTLRIHHRKCPKIIGLEKEWKKKRILIFEAKTLIGAERNLGSGLLQKEVLLKMQNDEVSRCAQADPLICNLGEVWLSKSIGHKLRRGRDSSFHMRLASKLLLSCRKRLEEPGLNMFQLLTMKNFDVIVEETLSLCGTNEHEELAHPSTANKVGFDLARLVSLKYGICLRKKDNIEKDEADGFLKLMRIHWGTHVTKRAAELLKERHFENRRQLPHPKDIETVAKKLSVALNGFDYKNKNQYREVAKTAVLRLMVYNRRRSGEIEELLMETFLSRKKEMDDVELSLLGNLTATEQYLIKSQELMWIRGKRGKRVPVLIPSDTVDALRYIVDSEVRALAGLKKTNKYMFATTGDGVISASQCIKEFGSASNLIHPDRLTSTGYRAYMATIAQCLGLKDHQIQWLCSHLGHTLNVHQIHYRFALEGIERIQLGKLLLLQDKNLLSKYKNTNLEDILEDADFEEIVHSADTGTQPLDSDKQPLEPDTPHMIDDGIEMEMEIDSPSSTVLTAAVQKEKSSGKRVRWTDQEISEIKRYAAKYLTKKKTPSRKVCCTFIQQSKAAGGELHRRSADLIVKKISAMNVKARHEDI